MPTPATSQDRSGVELDRIGYEYSTGTVALREVSLVVPSGSVVGIVGPSGCGKSTLLQILAGVRAPTDGSINRHEGPDAPPRAMVFQTDTLLPWLTAAENVGLYFRLHGTPRRRVRARIAELLELVDLTEFADAYPYELSGGMRRRVAFLAAVAPRPGLLLLDEPFSSLDEPTRIVIHQDVLRIVTEEQITVVLVTHDLGEAISLSDEVAILSARPGTIVSRHAIPFDRDRDVLHLRQTQEFLTIYGTLWRALSDQIGLSRAPASVAGGDDSDVAGR